MTWVGFPGCFLSFFFNYVLCRSRCYLGRCLALVIYPVPPYPSPLSPLDGENPRYLPTCNFFQLFFICTVLSVLCVYCIGLVNWVQRIQKLIKLNQDSNTDVVLCKGMQLPSVRRWSAIRFVPSAKWRASSPFWGKAESAFFFSIFFIFILLILILFVIKGRRAKACSNLRDLLRPAHCHLVPFLVAKQRSGTVINSAERITIDLVSVSF